MKDRIQDELARSDLTTQIAAAISDAIAIYQKQYFRFNESFTASFRTVLGQPNYNLLTDTSFSGVSSMQNLFEINWVIYTQNQVAYDIVRSEPEDIILANQVATQRGPPDQFAFMNETIMLYPTPDQGDGELGAIQTLQINAGGSGYASGIFTAPLTGGTGHNATALITITGGVVTALSVVNSGSGYLIGDLLSAAASTLGVQPLGPVTGQIAAFTMLSGGQGYLQGFFVTVPLTGGSGAGATANIIVSNPAQQGNSGPADAGLVTDVQIVNPGAGYLEGDILSANLQASSTGATTGSVGAIAIVFAGSGLVNASYTNLALTGGTGSGVTADVTVAGGTITQITIFNPGTGYTVDDILSVPVAGGSGQIASINLALGGFFYTNGFFPAHALTGGTGAGATADITVVGGTVTAVTIVNPGTGYIFGDLLSATGGGMGAGFGLSVQVLAVGTTVRVTSLSIGGIQGLIASLSNLVGGSSYTDGVYSNVVLTGGTGTGATANIAVSGGSITSIAVVSPGSGYLVGNILTAAGLGPGVGFSVTVATITTGAVTQSSASGFQIQITDISTGAAVTTISGSGFIAQVTGAITTVTGYEVTVGGQVAYAGPTSDAQMGNKWMTDGERLIRARAKYIIACHVTRNAPMMQAMSPDTPGGASYEAERELRMEANRILRRGVIRPMAF